MAPVADASNPADASNHNGIPLAKVSDPPRIDSRIEPGETRRRDGRGNQRGNSRDGSRDMTRDGFRDGPRDGRDGPRESGREGTRDQPGQNPRFAPPQGLGLPDEFKHLFEGDDDVSFYYVIWDQNGTVLAKSKPVDDIPFPNSHTKDDGLPVSTVRTREMQREVVHVSRFGPPFAHHDINVLVGRSLQTDLSALHRSGLLLSLTGLSVLVVGLAGGWWFSSRAIRPIAEMTATAESISVKNLSKRINVESTAAELEQLAVVLNHTFDRLQSAFERQSQFTADASHELRTPLSVILSHAELALARPRSPEEYQTAFNTCRRASLRMKSLIDSLLLLARFDSVEAELDLRPFELDRLAQEAVEMLQPLAAERHVQLSCRADTVSVRADRERLFQVISNLLSNAIRYNRPDGRVELEVTSNEQSAIIRVTDTGVGISTEHLPKIFDRFYRVDKARSHAEGGCGLGLAICQTIVEAHQGTITAISEPNVGTTIEVRLPVGNATDSVNSKSDSAIVPTLAPIGEEAAIH
jgi:heavy metal sensor kinase